MFTLISCIAAFALGWAVGKYGVKELWWKAKDAWDWLRAKFTKSGA